MSNFQFNIIAEKEYDDGIALTIAVENLPEDPSLLADESYNREHNLSSENSYKLEEAGGDRVAFSQELKDFLQNYVSKVGYKDRVSIEADNSLSFSGFDTPQDIGVKTEVWLPFLQTTASRIGNFRFSGRSLAR